MADRPLAKEWLLQRSKMRVLAALWFIPPERLPVQRVADVAGSCACAGLRFDDASTQTPIREINVLPLQIVQVPVGSTMYSKFDLTPMPDMYIQCIRTSLV